MRISRPNVPTGTLVMGSVCYCNRKGAIKLTKEPETLEPYATLKKPTLHLQDAQRAVEVRLAEERQRPCGRSIHKRKPRNETSGTE